MERLKASVSAAVFIDKKGDYFFVEYQTDLDLERLSREHGRNGSRLVVATTIDQAKKLTTQPRLTTDEETMYRR
jgi:hypothetical protein